MAVATGQPVSDLLGLDSQWLRALADAERDRWGPVEELLAVNVELTHALLLAFIAANSKKGTKLPKPLRIPRPGSAESTPSMSIGQMARKLAR